MDKWDLNLWIKVQKWGKNQRGKEAESLNISLRLWHERTVQDYRTMETKEQDPLALTEWYARWANCEEETISLQKDFTRAYPVIEKSLHKGIGKDCQYRVPKENSAQAAFCQKSDVISKKKRICKRKNKKQEKEDRTRQTWDTMEDLTACTEWRKIKGQYNKEVLKTRVW